MKNLQVFARVESRGTSESDKQEAERIFEEVMEEEFAGRLEELDKLNRAEGVMPQELQRAYVKAFNAATEGWALPDKVSIDFDVR